MITAIYAASIHDQSSSITLKPITAIASTVNNAAIPRNKFNRRRRNNRRDSVGAETTNAGMTARSNDHARDAASRAATAALNASSTVSPVTVMCPILRPTR